MPVLAPATLLKWTLIADWYILNVPAATSAQRKSAITYSTIACPFFAGGEDDR